jgi:sugar phosphate permease
VTAAHQSSRRWVVLALGVLAQTSTCVFLYGLPALLPLLRAPGQVAADGLSLRAAGVLVGAPSFGLLLTLIAWGAAADRYGERLVIAAGMTISAATLVVAARSTGFGALCACLVLAAAGAASVNAASGRMILGWFAVGQRGLAMGIRQTAQPLGVAVGALLLPAAGRRWGVHGALLVPGGLCLLLAVLILLFAPDPPRRSAVSTPGSDSPYRTPLLWRIHASSAALVVPQFAVSGFTLAYLVSERAWSVVDAGRFVFAIQAAGAVGRIGAGVWSDRAGSRLRPMRVLAVASTALMVAIAGFDLARSALVLAAFAVAAVVVVADNGLAFTSVAELAGSRWTGRALGVQNTGQNVVAALTPPLFGWAVQTHGYAAAFLLAAVFPSVAIASIPVRQAERREAAAA